MEYNTNYYNKKPPWCYSYDIVREREREREREMEGVAGAVAVALRKNAPRMSMSMRSTAGPATAMWLSRMSPPAACQWQEAAAAASGGGAWRRGFAAKPAKGGKGAAAAAASKLDLKGDMAIEEARGISLKKSGTDPALSKKRSDYPLWLWGLLGARPTLQDLQKKIAASPEGVHGLSESDYLRYRKIKRRLVIKDRNTEE